ncbi:porin [Rugamonas apoptosis]|uniref:Porin n=1 Tax=Rugamonas apoptosis TaxID=2758570 RepID=A0A7W2IIV2_9BURK|nr:porin [Rugamonas apoptosis]MBA5685682.1 porin [Rugamonas apoptosis]
MKKSLVALALMGAFSAAYAQSSVTIYGTVDAGVTKKTDTTTAIGKRDNNKLGFKGVEDLGSGLKALFQLEIRYEPDTGTLESGTRPLFQGESRVGLQGDFGTVRLGRGLTALQASNTAFEPWSGLPTPAGFQTDLQVAGYTTAYGIKSGSDPLGPAGNSANRFSNALFYNSPVFSGFQLNATVGTKENNGNLAAIQGTSLNPLLPQYAIGANGSAVPYSLSGTFNNGPLAAMAAYERNAIETKLWSIAAAVTPMPGLKLMGSYQKQDQGHTKLTNPDTKAWILGANYTVGAGKFLLGYGQKTPDGVEKTKQASAGYEYSLSTRTYVYGELSQRKNSLVAGDSVKYYGLGIHHNF